MKNTIFPPLTTEFAEKMDKSCPWNIYPRPQLKRDSFICLNGEWELEISESKEIPTAFSKRILVPFPIESQLSGIGRQLSKKERLYYRRVFTLPEGFLKDKLLLRFGAVDRLARIYINGKFAGVHNCGYLPFYADITNLITEGENEIIVEVKDDISHVYPYGKQKRKRGGMWYTPVSGIWQTVWLESVPENYIESVRFTPTLDSVKIDVFSNAKQKKITLLDSGESYDFYGNTITVTPKSIINWTPENPYLYRIKIETENDSVESYFALREISSKRIGENMRLCLNGEPYLFNGLLDQGYFPDGLFLPATPEGYEKDILLAKSLGFNTLRKHIKIEPEIFYYLCDKLGIAVFQDMVNNSGYSFIRDTVLPSLGFKRKNDKKAHSSIDTREAFIECMTATANLLYNHPSVVYYTIFNEGWGQFDSDELYEMLSSRDKTRIIDSTSGWFAQRKSDVDSYHVYFKKPILKPSYNRPLVLSEFGGFSHRVDGHLFGQKNYGYSKYDSREDFENAVAELYESDVMSLVKNDISALIYTQLSDIEDETNGFVTYDRRVLKVSTERMSAIAKKLADAARPEEESN